MHPMWDNMLTFVLYEVHATHNISVINSQAQYGGQFVK